MNERKLLNQKRNRREKRSKAKLFGSSKKPRLAIFRSNRLIYGQLIDDENRNTLASASSLELKPEEKKKTKTKQAESVGEILAKKALALGVKEAVFDRRSYRYHGRVLHLAEAVRKNGIKI
jgi:large subunit ribosomal protein L18